MFETVTVDEAINKGRKTVAYPSMGITFSLFIISIVINALGIISHYDMYIGLIAGVLLGWLYRSLTVTKWRLWAFENVKNVHDLQRKAIDAQIIWPVDSFLEKTEFTSAADKAKWEALQYKFKQKDVFDDDPAIPEETIILYSPKVVLYMSLFIIAALGLGVYLSFTKGLVIAAIPIGGAIFLSYKAYKKATDKEPQIILNDKGIETISSAFVEWKDIFNEEVITINENRSSDTYLQYYFLDSFQRVDIGDLDTDKNTLENLLHVYRLRNENILKKKNKETIT
jgi:acyl-CoA-binding protein